LRSTRRQIGIERLGFADQPVLGFHGDVRGRSLALVLERSTERRLVGPKQRRRWLCSAARALPSIVPGAFRFDVSGRRFDDRTRRWQRGRRWGKVLLTKQSLPEPAELRTIAAALLRPVRAVALAGWGATAFAVVPPRASARLAAARRGLVRRLMPVVVLGLDVGHVEKAIASDREVDERGLDRRLEVDDLPLVDIAGVALVAGPFDVELLEDAVFDDGNAAFLGLEHVDEHFFLHAGVFLSLSAVQAGLVKGPRLDRDA
jgi:hypothetical protein